MCRLVVLLGAVLWAQAAWPAADPTADLVALADGADRADRCFNHGFLEAQAFFARKAKSDWGTPVGRLDLDWLAATWPTIKAELDDNHNLNANEECENENDHEQLSQLIADVETRAAQEVSNHPAEDYPLLMVSSISAKAAGQIMRDVRSLVIGDAKTVGFIDKDYLPELDGLASTAENDDPYVPYKTYWTALGVMDLLFVSSHTKYSYVGYPALPTGPDVVKQKLKLLCGVVDIYKRYIGIDDKALDDYTSTKADYADVERRKTTCDDYLSSYR